MENSYIPRTLWFTENNQPKEISQAELFTEKRSLVILGEAGMGKTQLLKSLGKHPDYAYCTAKQLIRKARPEELLGDAEVLVIDALDEAPSHQENDAIDEVLRKLDGLALSTIYSFVQSRRMEQRDSCQQHQRDI